MNLNDKAIKIQGKSYVLVSDRILYFNETYKEGCITTDLVKYEDKQIIIKATVYPEWLQGRTFTGYSQSIEWQGYINKTSALENAETSAVGRALAMMGIWVIDSIASVDEINKAKGAEKSQWDWEFDKKNFTPTMFRSFVDDLKKGKRTKDLPQTIEYITNKYILSPEIQADVEQYHSTYYGKDLADELASTVEETFTDNK